MIKNNRRYHWPQAIVVTKRILDEFVDFKRPIVMHYMGWNKRENLSARCLSGFVEMFGQRIRAA